MMSKAKMDAFKANLDLSQYLPRNYLCSYRLPQGTAVYFTVRLLGQVRTLAPFLDFLICFWTFICFSVSLYAIFTASNICFLSYRAKQLPTAPSFEQVGSKCQFSSQASLEQPSSRKHAGGRQD